MNKLCLMLILMIIRNVKFSNGYVMIPQADKEFAIGFLDGSELKTFLNLNTCEKEFYEILSELFEVFDSLYKNDNKSESFRRIGQSFIIYSQLREKCIGTKEKFEIILNRAKTAFYDPQKFLIGIMDNAVSFHVVKLYWGLTGKIKEGKFYEVGTIFGDIFKYILNVDLERKELSFLSEINMKKESNDVHSECIENIFDLLNRIYTFFKSILFGTGENKKDKDYIFNFISNDFSENYSKLVYSCLRK